MAQGVQENKPPFATKAQPKEYKKNLNNLNKYPTIQKKPTKATNNLDSGHKKQIPFSAFE